MTRRYALVVGVVFAMFATPALAGHPHQSQTTQFCGERYGACPGAEQTKPAKQVRGRHLERTVSAPAPAAAPMPSLGGLAASAGNYIGSTAATLGLRRNLWCGAFMDMLLKRNGRPGGGNLASAYGRYGSPASYGCTDCLAVMGRKGGGHVGVVKGYDRGGNPIIISGNHNRVVAESVYPRGRIYAYRWP